MVPSFATAVIPYHLPFISVISSLDQDALNSFQFYIKQKSGTERGQSHFSTPPCGVMEMGGGNSRLRDRGDDLGVLPLIPLTKIATAPIIVSSPNQPLVL